MKSEIWLEYISLICSVDRDLSMSVGQIIRCNYSDYDEEVIRRRPHDAPDEWPPRRLYVWRIEYDVSDDKTVYICKPDLTESGITVGIRCLVEDRNNKSLAEFIWPFCPRRGEYLEISREFAENRQPLGGIVSEVTHSVCGLAPYVRIQLFQEMKRGHDVKKKSGFFSTET